MTRSLRLILSIMWLAACGPKAASTSGDDTPTGDGDPGCADTCSADLRHVTDCSGNTITTCADDEACSDGTCMSACEAAADNKSSIGCDYYAVAPDVIAQLRGACFAAYVANTSPLPVTITVEHAGMNLPIDGFARIPSGQGQALTYAPLPGGQLPPGQIAILFLSRAGALSASCPAGITPAVTIDPSVPGTGRGHAFHITTSQPTIAYDIFPYGGGNAAATSATLLLPTSAWDVNYVGVDAYAASTAAGSGQPFIAMVGKEDNTTVTIRPSVAIVGGGGIAPAAQGANVTYSLAAGEVLQLTQSTELAGSAITADKPIGLWGGLTCLNIPTNMVACDSAHQQIPPVQAMGDHYAAVRYRNRFAGQEETVPWRLVGAVDGTILSYSPATPTNAPTTLAQGQIVEFNAPGPFTVRSQDKQHPFYMSAHMTGWQLVAGNTGDNRGDPEFVNVIPPEQYLSQYTFFTDPTYPETNLVLTRMKTNGTFADVAIDCAGTVTGWTPIDAAGDMEYARVDLVTGNFESVNGCNNGLHTATSAQPFGLVVWGWGSAASTGFFSLAVSYAYPAGQNVKAINQVIVQ